MCCATSPPFRLTRQQETSGWGTEGWEHTHPQFGWDQQCLAETVHLESRHPAVTPPNPAQTSRSRPLPGFTVFFPLPRKTCGCVVLRCCVVQSVQFSFFQRGRSISPLRVETDKLHMFFQDNYCCFLRPARMLSCWFSHLFWLHTACLFQPLSPDYRSFLFKFLLPLMPFSYSIERIMSTGAAAGRKPVE